MFPFFSHCINLSTLSVGVFGIFWHFPFVNPCINLSTLSLGVFGIFWFSCYASNIISSIFGNISGQHGASFSHKGPWWGERFLPEAFNKFMFGCFTLAQQFCLYSLVSNIFTDNFCTTCQFLTSCKLCRKVLVEPAPVLSSISSPERPDKHIKKNERPMQRTKNIEETNIQSVQDCRHPRTIRL